MQVCNSPSFGAKLIATSGNLKLYKLTESSDIKALKRFAAKTDIQDLMPKCSRQDADRWHEMLEYAIDSAQSPGNVTYVESANNKLCGIISYFPNGTSTIDCICTIPIEKGKKVKLAGKTLFYQVFQDFLEYKGSRINLSAITNGPYNTINKYKELGFSETTHVTKTYVDMSANRHKIKEAWQKLKEIINYKPQKPTRVDLSEML